MAQALSSMTTPWLSIRLVLGMALSWFSLVVANEDYSKSELCTSGEGPHCLAGRLIGQSYLHSLAIREWIGTPITLQSPRIYIGSEPLETGIDAEYVWGYSADRGRGTYLASRRPSNMPDQDKYAALAWIFNADVYWGNLVMLQADLQLRGVWGYVSLFVEVFNEESGNTIALDNMRDRRIRRNGRFSVVVGVPDPRVGNGDSCPAIELIPDAIQVGFLLAGARGFVEMTSAKFGLATGPITGGPAPWVGPPAMVGYRGLLP